MAYRTQNRDRKETDVKNLQPPQSVETEQEILGGVLKDVTAIHHVIDTLESENHFYVPKHQKIYRAILDLYEQSEPVDITTVSEQLLRLGTLEDVGGRVYLVELVEGVISSANIVSHARIVLEKSISRQLIATSSEIIGSCYTMEKPVEELLDQAESLIFKVSQDRHRQGFIPIKTLITGAIDEISSYQDGGPTDSLMTGFDELDRKMQGLKKGELIVLAGRPSMGKTSLAMNIAENIATRRSTDKTKAPGVALFSIEMSASAIGMRLLCSLAKKSQQKLRSGRISDDDWKDLTFAGSKLNDANIFVDDSPTLSALELRAKARRLKAKEDVGLVIVDYIQLMHSPGRTENRQQEIATISRNLKSLAKELDIPIIAISQLSRQVESRESKRPQLSDLRESGAIEQDADIVMFVYREEFYVSQMDQMEPKVQAKLAEVEGKAEIIIAKQRNGPTGVCYLQFEKDFARFGNLAPNHREIPQGATRVDDHGETPF